MTKLHNSINKDKNWKNIGDNPLMFENKDIQITMGQNLDGNYDVWVQRDDKVIRWIAGGHLKKSVPKSKAIALMNDYMNKR